MADSLFDDWELEADAISQNEKNTADAPPASTKDVESITEKMRLQRLVEDADACLVDDLFPEAMRTQNDSASAGVKQAPSSKPRRGVALQDTIETNADPMDRIQLKTFAECEAVATKIASKITFSTTRSSALLRFLDVILGSAAKKMEVKDMATFSSKVKSALNDLQTAQKRATQSSRKISESAPSCRNYQDEMDMMYGDEDSESGDEEYFKDLM